MREKLSKKEALTRNLSILRWAIVICALIGLFGAILICGTLDGIFEDTSDNISYAGTSDAVETSAGTVVSFATDNMANITAASMGYPGSSGTTTFNSGNITTNNTSFAAQSNISYSYKAVGNPDAPSPSFTASDGQFQVYYDAVSNNRYEYGWSVVNLNLNDNPIFKKLTTSSLISSVVATVSFSFASTGDTTGYTYGCSATGKKANDYSCGDSGSGMGSSGNVSGANLTIKSSATATPQNYIYFGIYCRTDNTWTGDMKDGYARISGITVSLKFTRVTSTTDAASTYIDDGAAPQVTNIDTSTDNLKVQPYRVAAGDTSNSYGWPVWYDTTTQTGSQVNRLLSKASDVCQVGSKIKLYSYTKTEIFTWNSEKLYKRVSFTVQDYFDFDGTGTPQAATYPLQASGIGSIQVGAVKSDSDGAIFSYASATGTMTNTSTLSAYASATVRPIYVLYNETSYQQVGYAYIKRTASNYSGRQTATVVCYFSKNANVTVTISDFGNMTIKQNIEVRGIDTTAAVAPNVPSDVISAEKTIATTKDFLNIEWIYTEKPNFELNDNTDVDAVASYDEGVNPNSPYVYYYDMQKLSGRNPGSNFSSYTKKSLDTLKTWIPFNVGYIDSFVFDFSRGCTSNGVYPGGTVTSSNPQAFQGNGYYHLIIYAVDLSGNYSTTTSVVEYYFKVDYEEAEYTITMNYDFEDLTNTITPATNGTWATNQLELVIQQSTVSYSGNTIVFSDYDDKAHTIVIGSKSTTIAKKDLGCDVYSIDDLLIANVPTAVLSYDNDTWYQIVENQIYFKASIIGLSEVTYEYKFLFCPTIQGIETYLNFDYQTTFEIANGISYDDAEVVYTNPDWKNSSNELGVLIKIDRNKPMNPDFSDVDYTYFQDSLTYMPSDEATFDVQLGLKTSYGENTTRYWYTSGYTINSQIFFSDAMADTFRKAVRVYIGQKNIEYIGGSFANFIREEELTTNIDQATRTNLTAYASRMDTLFGESRWRVIDGGNFGDEAYALNNYDLFQRDSIGLRVIYIWAVDQAGNMSEISVKYILVDPTTYHVNSKYYTGDVEKFGVNTGTISIVNADERIISTFKRNETILLVSDLTDGFVPYKLNKYVGSETTPIVLGENTTSGTTMVLNDGIIMTYSSGTYTYSIPTDIDSVFSFYNTNTTENPNNDGIVFEVMYRKVLNVELNVPYGRYAGVDDLGNPLLVLPYVISDTSDDARQALSFTWYLDEDKLNPTGPATRAASLAEYATPVNASDDPYFVVISTDSIYYIIEQVIESPFTINPASLVISVKENAPVQYKRIIGMHWEDIFTITGLCGVDIDNYAIDGLDIFENTWEIGLRNSNAQDVPISNDITVGFYTPYLKSPFVLNNYNVTFVTAQIEVTKYELTAILYNATKVYGNDDPIFKFGILKEAFTDIGITYSDVFVSDAVNYVESGEYYIFTPTTQWIKRLVGENVGTYTYTTNINDFAVADSGNYTVSIDLTDEPVFTITQRTITAIPEAGQESLDTVGTIRYGFSSVDAKYFTSEYVTGELGTSYIADTTDGNYLVQRYTITLGTLAPVNTDNITIALSSSSIEYHVKIYNGSNTLIKVTQIAEFEFTYGEVGTPTLAWDNVHFTTEDLPDGYTIEWTAPAGINNATTVGNYLAQVESIVVKNGSGEADASYDVAVAAIALKVNPKALVVTPSVTKNTRPYGYLDSDATNGIAFTYSASIANIIESGELVRGVYNATTGALIAKGSRFDPASDAQGNTTYNGVAAYYGFAVGTEFVLNNTNYIIEFADEYYDARFVIEPRKLILGQTTDFYGVSKGYDGTTSVVYNAGDLSVNYSDKLARSSDDVAVLFTAVYDSAEIGNRTITFSALSLTGADAGNYVLYLDNATTPYVDQTISITVLTPGSTEHIQIVKAVVKIYISKSDITISKQYDGTTTMRAADVSMGASSMLNTYISAVQQSAYPAAAVSNDYITEVKIVFNYDVTSGDSAQIIIKDDDITLTPGAGVFTLTIKDMPVYITRRELTIDSFARAVGVNKYYDTTSFVDVDVTLKDGVLISGDYIEDIGLEFEAHAAQFLRTFPGAGNYDKSVVYQGVTSYFKYVKNVADAQNVNVFIESATTKASSNYVINVTEDEWAQFCAKNEDTLKVSIFRAEVEPTLTIAARQYNGSVDVNASLIRESTTITSTISSKFIVRSSYNKEFMGDIYAELENISYDLANLKVLLTKDGVKYPYVTFDETGLLVRHAVSFENLILTNAGSLAEDEVNTILSNYTLYGTFYNVSAEGKTAVATDKPQLLLGNFIADGVYDAAAEGLGYESTITMLINRKNIVVRPVSVSVENKVYDGTTTGSAEIKDPASIGVEAIDADHIDISLTATYSQRDVGTEIRVDINNVRLTNKIGSEMDYVANYEVTNTAVYTNRSITPSYATINFDLAKKTYDGTNSIAQSAIKPSISVPYDRDRNNYSVNYSFGFLGGKDVVVDGGDASSDTATIYGVKLVSSRTAVNYNLYLKKEVDFDIFDDSGDFTAEYIAYVKTCLIGVLDTSILALDGTIVDDAKYQAYVKANDYAATKFYYARENDNRTAYVTLPVVTIKTFKYTDYSSGKLLIDDESKIIGQYVSNTIRYVAAREDAVITIPVSSPATYDERQYTEVPIVKQFDHFVGPAALTFKIGAETNNFAKQYDGTKKINGAVIVGRTTEKTGVEGLAYNEVTGKWGGYTINFDIPLSDAQKAKIVFLAEYQTSNCGVQNIIFKILNDDDYPEFQLDDPNYSSVSTTVTVVGEIKKATIHALLEDNSVPYGTMIRDRVDTIRYSTNASFSISKPLPLTNGHNTDTLDLYVINGVLGYFKDTDTSETGVKYYTYDAEFVQATDAQIMDEEHYHFYIENAGEYQLVSSLDPGETYYICTSVEIIEREFELGGTNYVFVPVQGSLNTPKVITNVTNATNVGTYSATIQGGNATNYIFECDHTNYDHSNIEVTPLKVYVYAEDVYVDEEGATVNYANSMNYDATKTIPQFALGYAQSTTSQLSGFVNGQTATELIRNGELVAPTTQVRLFDGTNPGTAALTMADLQVVTDKLEAGQFYYIYIDLTGASARNYELELKAGAAFDADKIAKLLVEYPHITNYSVVNTIKTYNGSPINVDYIGEGGTVTYKYYTNAEMTSFVGTSVTNAGEYYAEVKVVKEGFKDWYGYATLKIKKASFKITIPAIDVDYDGLSKTASIRLSNVAPSTSDISITYQKGTETVSTPQAVGIYTVIAKYEAEENLENFPGGQYQYNFNSTFTNGALVIHGAVIQVTVNEDDKNTMIKTEGEVVGLNYKLSVDEKYYDMLSNAGWDYEDLNAIVEDGGIIIKYFNVDSLDTEDYLDEITEMGVYNYVFTEGYGANIVLSGDVSGSFTVGTNKLDNQNNKQRTIITSVGNTILNADTQLLYENVVYTSKISSSATTAQYNAIKANNTLYTQIESNIPSLETKFYETATLKGILKVQMRMNNNDGTTYMIQPNGKVKVTVQVPTSYEIDEQTSVYRVTDKGTLEKVEYTVNGKNITYETDYVNTIVFVRVNTFMEWLLANWWLIAVAGAALLIILVIIIVPSAIAGKKKRAAKKAALAAQGAGAGEAAAPTESTSAPVQDTAPEAPAPAPEEPAVEAPPVEEPPADVPPPVEEPPMEEPPIVEEPPVETPPTVEEPPVVEEPAPAPEVPEEPAPAPAPEEPEVPKKAPPPGAVGTKAETPKKAPPPGAVGTKKAEAPKKAPPPGAVGQKKAAAPKKAPPPGAIGKKD
ncbi:MAG: hypothetical protein J5656_03350 [Clostridia bacterium]|nr:hypothetical protein [Clostridia bacterium]